MNATKLDPADLEEIKTQLKLMVEKLDQRPGPAPAIYKDYLIQLDQKVQENHNSLEAVIKDLRKKEIIFIISAVILVSAIFLMIFVIPWRVRREFEKRPDQLEIMLGRLEGKIDGFLQKIRLQPQPAFQPERQGTSPGGGQGPGDGGSDFKKLMESLSESLKALNENQTVLNYAIFGPVQDSGKHESGRKKDEPGAARDPGLLKSVQAVRGDLESVKRYLIKLTTPPTTQAPPTEPARPARPAERLFELIEEMGVEEKAQSRDALRRMKNYADRYRDLARAVGLTMELRPGLSPDQDSDLVVALDRLNASWLTIESDYGFRSRALDEIRGLTAERLAAMGQGEVSEREAKLRREFNRDLHALRQDQVDEQYLSDRLDEVARDVFNFFQSHKKQLSNHLAGRPVSDWGPKGPWESYFQEVMNLAGIKEIEVRPNDRLDPKIHERLDSVIAQGIGDGKVAEVRRTGYVIKGSEFVLRKAGVTVNAS